MKVFKFNQDYIAERTKWFNHPSIYNVMYIKHPLSEDETRSWYERNKDRDDRIDFVVTDEGVTVAMCGLLGLGTQDRLAEYYLMVNPELPGKGYGFKTTVYVMNFVFSNTDTNKVFLYTNHENDKANNLYLKVGFKLEGVLRQHRFKNGKLIDRNIFGLLKEEWVVGDWYQVSGGR